MVEPWQVEVVQQFYAFVSLFFSPSLLSRPPCSFCSFGFDGRLRNEGKKDKLKEGGLRKELIHHLLFGSAWPGLRL